MSKLIEIREHLASLYRDGADVIKQYPDSDFPAEVEESFKARNAEIADLTAQKVRLEENEALAKTYGEQNDHYNKPAARPRFQGAPNDGAKSSGPRSLGQAFVESEEWTDFMQKAAPNGLLSEKIRITSPQVQFKSLQGLEQKALVTGAAVGSGGALVWPDILPGVVPLPWRPLVMRDIITVGTTASDTIEYAREVSRTNAAAPVAEATTTSNGTKPESALVLEKVTTPVKTIAHWIPATKRALADAGQLRTIIDSFLMMGLEQVLEDQMIAGDGSGENLDGIGHMSGTQSQAFDTDLLTTIRKARTLVETIAFAVPRAILMNPNDKETFDLLQDNEGRYYFGGPAGMNNLPIWSMPVVQSLGVPAGTAYVGDFKTCVLWDREQGGIQVSDSHASFFIQNLVAILAEGRFAFGCLRPVSIIEVALS